MMMTDQHLRIPATLTQSLPDSAWATRTILIVEDEEGISRLLTRLFNRQGYPTAIAVSVKEALEVLARSPAAVGLITLDLQLKVGGTGNQLLAELSQLAPALPVVVISSSLEELRATGQVKATFAKPFDPLAVLAVVNNLLA